VGYVAFRMNALHEFLLGSSELSRGASALRLPVELIALLAYVVMRGGAERAELAELPRGAGARHNRRRRSSRTRVSDYTAFFYEGVVIEHADTNTMFTNPKEQRTNDYITGRFG
jgi:hypothetical protein